MSQLKTQTQNCGSSQVIGVWLSWVSVLKYNSFSSKVKSNWLSFFQSLSPFQYIAGNILVDFFWVGYISRVEPRKSTSSTLVTRVNVRGFGLISLSKDF